MEPSRLVGFVLLVISILVTAKVVKGIRIKSVFGTVVFALVLSILNYFLLGPLTLIGLPFIIVTLGIGFILLNAFIWWLAGKIVSSVELDGYGAAIKASIVTWLVNWVLLKILT